MSKPNLSNFQSADFIAKQSPEMDLLLLCARTHIQPVEAETIQTLVQSKLNWDLILATAESHKIHLLLYQALSQICPVSVPELVFEQLRSQFRLNTVKVFHLTSELLKLIEFLQSQGIPVIPLKGPILATLAYNNLSLRIAGDLDFLVHKKDYEKLKAILETQGYVIPLLSHLPISDVQRQSLFWSSGQYPMMHYKKNICLDIHWKLLSQDTLKQHLDFSYFCTRLQPVELAGKSVASLSPVDALLHLCLHGTKDFWSSIRSVCDIAELVNQNPDLSWTELLQTADTLGAKRTICLGLQIAHQLLNMPLPVLIEQQIAADKKVQWLANRVCQRLCCKPAGLENASLFEKLVFQLALIDGWQHKLVYCCYRLDRSIRLLFRVNYSDQAFLSLPQSLHGLYYFLRPVRLMRDHGLGLLRLIF